MTAINDVTDLANDGEIAVLTLNSPPVNALSAPVRDGLADGFKQAIADDDAESDRADLRRENLHRRRRHQRIRQGAERREPVRCAERDGEFAEARHRRHSRHRARRRTRSGARAVTTAWPCLPRVAACRKSISVCFPAPAARSACRASWVREKALEMVTIGPARAGQGMPRNGSGRRARAGRKTARERRRFRARKFSPKNARSRKCARTTRKSKPRADTPRSSPISAKRMPANSAAFLHPNTISAASKRP